MNPVLRFLYDRMLPYPRLYQFAKSSYERAVDVWRRLFTRRKPMDRLLVGGENAIRGAKYSRLTGDIARSSTPIGQSAHVEFLRQYKEIGDEIFQPDVLRSTAYYRNALEAIDLCGYYFGAQQESDIVGVAREFIANFEGKADYSDSTGRSRAGSPVVVARICASDGCYEVVDGHHRLAVACARGEADYPVYVSMEKCKSTPMQDLLMDCLWTRGERIRYQPLDIPEVQGWHLVRNCEDRFAMISAWSRDAGLPEQGSSSYVDLGCSYGWFVSKMRELGFAAYGVERDTAAIKIGQTAYGLEPDRYIVKELVNYCEEAEEQYDIVSCFSVLHHFVLRKARISAEQFVQHLDRLTRTALFIDTGQAHEKWFKNILPEWNDDYIESWILNNTSFTTVRKLGCDTDDKGRYSENYARSLFVCTRER